MQTSELIAASQGLREALGLREDPIAFFCSERQPEGYRPAEGAWACMVAALARARLGETVYFDREHFGCGGCGYYLGFVPPRPELDYFVSTGIPGKLEGEHYKKSPELVRALREGSPPRPATAPYAVFRPLAALSGGERPEILICFATPDELAGLVALANYPRAEDAVVCAFASGCGSLVPRVLKEAQHDPPRGVLGMFDPSARPFVPENELTFAAPLALWEEMLGNYQESFLRTETWAKVKKRMGKAAGPETPA